MGTKATKVRRVGVELASSQPPPKIVTTTTTSSTILQPLQYDATVHKWQKQKPNEEASTLVRSSLRVATYNVFFGQNGIRARFRHILDMLPELDADVLCIQEANAEWVEEMTGSEYVQQNYYVSDVNCTTFTSYGVVTLSRLPMVDLSMWKLPTKMGRSVLVASYLINGKPISIANVHLESLNSAPLRKEQLRIISGILASSPHAALVGDFNFDSQRNFRMSDLPLENDCIVEFYPDYVDVWAALRPDERGLTFDSEVNRMIPNYEQMRYDRVLLKSANGNWRPKRIELIGTEPVPHHTNLWPSDHFGLVAHFEFSDTTDESAVG
jgi:tyrosyl-DNA phosphodiesterase 2